VRFHFRDNIEWSLNIDTEVLVELTLVWFLWILISVDNVPLLVDLSVFAVDNDVLVLSISASRYIHYLSFLIDDESSI